mgnify:CR=1 FL=1
MSIPARFQRVVLDRGRAAPNPHGMMAGFASRGTPQTFLRVGALGHPGLQAGPDPGFSPFDVLPGLCPAPRRNI